MNPPRKPRFPLIPAVWLEHAASDLKLGMLGRDQGVLPAGFRGPLAGGAAVKKW